MVPREWSRLFGQIHHLVVIAPRSSRFISEGVNPPSVGMMRFHRGDVTSLIHFASRLMT
jgi:hypothetical protein